VSLLIKSWKHQIAGNFPPREPRLAQSLLV